MVLYGVSDISISPAIMNIKIAVLILLIGQ
jgi:hypothetical protein